VRRRRERITVGAGEEIRISTKVIHTFEADTDSNYTFEFRPALRTEEFFRDLFALPTDRRGNPRIGDSACLMRAHPGRVPVPPLRPSAAAARTRSAALQGQIRFPLAVGAVS
jgi:hypothetical protein